VTCYVLTLDGFPYGAWTDYFEALREFNVESAKPRLGVHLWLVAYDGRAKREIAHSPPLSDEDWEQAVGFDLLMGDETEEE